MTCGLFLGGCALAPAFCDDSVSRKDALLAIRRSVLLERDVEVLRTLVPFGYRDLYEACFDAMYFQIKNGIFSSHLLRELEKKTVDCSGVLVRRPLRAKRIASELLRARLRSGVCLLFSKGTSALDGGSGSGRSSLIRDAICEAQTHASGRASLTSSFVHLKLDSGSLHSTGHNPTADGSDGAFAEGAKDGESGVMADGSGDNDLNNSTDERVKRALTRLLLQNFEVPNVDLSDKESVEMLHAVVNEMELLRLFALATHLVAQIEHTNVVLCLDIKDTETVRDICESAQREDDSSHWSLFFAMLRMLLSFTRVTVAAFVPMSTRECPAELASLLEFVPISKASGDSEFLAQKVKEKRPELSRMQKMGIVFRTAFTEKPKLVENSLVFDATGGVTERPYAMEVIEDNDCRMFGGFDKIDTFEYLVQKSHKHSGELNDENRQSIEETLAKLFQECGRLICKDTVETIPLECLHS